MKILITGASASGKSEYAEKITHNIWSNCGRKGRLVYIATMHREDNDEYQKRVDKHRKQRSGYGYLTIEKETDIHQTKLANTDTVLLECMSNLLANEMFISNKNATDAVDYICSGVETLCKQCHNIVMVTNEVFSDGCEYDEYTRAYIEALSLINRRIAGIVDRMTEVVYTIPVDIFGGIYEIN